MDVVQNHIILFSYIGEFLKRHVTKTKFGSLEVFALSNLIAIGTPLYTIHFIVYMNMPCFHNC